MDPELNDTQPAVMPNRQQLADILKQMGVNPSDFMGGGLQIPGQSQGGISPNFSSLFPGPVQPMGMAARGNWNSMRGPLQQLGSMRQG